jgi:hypothetical protein
VDRWGFDRFIDLDHQRKIYRVVFRRPMIRTGPIVYWIIASLVVIAIASFFRF